MDRKVLILVGFVVLASGCSSSSGGINVEGMSVTPDKIVGGNEATVSLEVINAGKVEANVSVGGKGGEVLVNHCPDIFNLNLDSASSSTNSEKEDSYELGENERLSLYWTLAQNDRTVPRSGYTCDLQFELPFEYSAESYQQIQIKENREVEGIPDLTSDVSGGPLSVEMEVIGGTAQTSNTIIEGDEADIYIRLRNRGDSESSYTGLVEIEDEDVNIETVGGIEFTESCGESAEIEMGEDKVYRCPIDTEDIDGSSVRGAVDVSVDYTFVQDLGSRTIEVERSGN